MPMLDRLLTIYGKNYPLFASLIFRTCTMTYNKHTPKMHSYYNIYREFFLWFLFLGFTNISHFSNVSRFCWKSITFHYWNQKIFSKMTRDFLCNFHEINTLSVQPYVVTRFSGIHLKTPKKSIFVTRLATIGVKEIL